MILTPLSIRKSGRTWPTWRKGRPGIRGRYCEIADKSRELPLLGGDDDTANRAYTKRFALAHNRARGQAHGLEYAEYFHYIPPDESEVEEYVAGNAVPV